METMNQQLTIAAAALALSPYCSYSHTIYEQIEKANWYKQELYKQTNAAQNIQTNVQQKIQITQAEYDDIANAKVELRQQGRVHRLDKDFTAMFRMNNWTHTFKNIDEYNTFCDYTRAQLDKVEIYKEPVSQNDPKNKQPPTNNPQLTKTQELQLKLGQNNIPFKTIQAMYSNDIANGQTTYKIDNVELPLTTTIVNAVAVISFKERKQIMDQLVNQGEFKLVDHKGKKIYYQTQQ